MKPYTIMIAEDDPDDKWLIEDAFNELSIPGNRCYVEDGQVLLEKLQEASGRLRQNDGLPDLILLDIRMPRVSGLEALAEIRANPALHQIPVVVLTTSNSQDDILTAQNLGACAYFTKPARFSQLLAIVEEIMEILN